MSYRIVLAHSDREELAHALKKAISQALADTRITADQLEIAIELSNDGVNQAVAYLASEEGRVDLKVNAMIQEALNVNVPIIPIVMKDEALTIPEKLPESLSHHNVAFWQDEGASVALTLLRTIGLTESQRKVFISYRRSETSDLADQLHTTLVQRGYDVFLDRFSIHAGDYFPRRIDENLADKTFLLLLESNGLQKSPWVQYEINFAIENHLGLTALNLPDCVNNMSEINETIRFRLTHDNLTKEGTLTPQALSRYLQHIESAHARALRRRRLRLLGSTMERLHAKGYSCQQVGEWCVLVLDNKETDAHLYWLTPRLPAITDFYGLYRQQEQIASDLPQRLKGTVVYDLPHLSGEHQALMNWLSVVAEKGLAKLDDI